MPKSHLLFLPVFFAFVLSHCATVRIPSEPANSAPRSTGLSEDGYGLTRSSERSSDFARPKRRPGLATGWGRDQASQIKWASFERGSRRPDDVHVLHYNDQAGARAMSGLRFKRYGYETTDNGWLKVALKNAEGRVMPSYQTRGRRVYIGETGQRYSVSIKNTTNRRLETVVSVDGLDVMDGRTASHGKRGYIIEPGRTLDIKGFRKDMDSVASFRLTSVDDSYANRRHGDTRNVGVVGVAVFHEKDAHPDRRDKDELRRRRGADPFPGRFATPPLW